MNSKTQNPSRLLLHSHLFKPSLTNSSRILSSPSSYTDATPFLSPTSSDQPDTPSPITENQLELELVNLLHYNNNFITLTIHQLLHSILPSESSNQSTNVTEARALRVFKRKHPNAQSQLLISRSQSARLFSFHPQHTNTKEF